MALVNFTLSEDGVGAFNDALVCIHKFSDDVSLEIKKDKLVLTALNLTKSAYVSFIFAANRFFARFNFEGNAQYRERFFCSIYIKARPCDVAIDDGPGKKSRFIAKIFCRNGITATHRLSFEAKAPVHAKFDKNEAINHWTINSRTLRSLMEHFGPGIDLLDINTDGENVVNFTCFTEKQVSVNNEGKLAPTVEVPTKSDPDKASAVLKKPLHTSIAVEMDEFDDIEVADKLHIIISVKDFRAILQHANWTSGDLNAAYSRPGRPMKISYGCDGMVCEFVLMTVDEKSTAVQRKSQGKAATKAARPSLNAATNTPAPDEDEMWAPVNPDDDEEGENPRLEWDASNEPNPSTMRISDHSGNTQSNPPNESGGPLPPFVEPTQRVSEVRRFGLFPDW
ncbi:putative cell cycle [Diaporthe ampelina]|uniref:DNA repair protein rad9 n=1 Tax=Diaporthe ampelina TaxID=1214573 RepID=A0A0G2FBD9_9PEZI|nr:putative cell cycle [Diaporthe ampelina]